MVWVALHGEEKSSYAKTLKAGRALSDGVEKLIEAKGVQVGFWEQHLIKSGNRYVSELVQSRPVGDAGNFYQRGESVGHKLRLRGGTSQSYFRFIIPGQPTRCLLVGGSGKVGEWTCTAPVPPPPKKEPRFSWSVPPWFQNEDWDKEKRERHKASKNSV